MIKRDNRIYLNREWQYSDQFEEKMVTAMQAEATTVELPHTVEVLPYNYFDESLYQKCVCYQRKIAYRKEMQEKRVFLVFEGVAHCAKVFLNGSLLCKHANGYTAFEVELTQYMKETPDNLLTVMVDSRENLNIPPFGKVIDYMTYGGIYRDVYLEVREKTFLSDAFIYATNVLDKPKLNVKPKFSGQTEGMELEVFLKKEDNWESLGSADAKNNTEFVADVNGVNLWSVDEPNLYEVKVVLSQEGTIIDQITDTIGFREAIFKEDGFYLNGKKLKIRGVNRHQSYAYVGYAMPKSMQKYDAQICKKELKVNGVRTSHYPQSQYFVEECDRLGLLVFTELPGWQHIGDEAWKAQACRNVEEMVMQYRNHPSVILWGVRINESIDDEAFYTKTNQIAHTLDATRQTSGVRFIEKSQLLEDVYAFNDFSHMGDNAGCKRKAEVTPNPKKGYLISENNGHMFPTKAFDDERHRVEHVKRHAKVLDDVASQEDIAGSFTWCMFDYNTHKDFGSGDRICYHGVMDMFRNPKQASGVYASQQDDEVYFDVVSTMDIGEHPAGNLGEVYAVTNADSVRLYKNEIFIKEFYRENTPYKYLKHGPILIDDFIGEQLVEVEGMPKQKADEVKQLLLYVGKYGMTNLPAKAKLLAAKLITIRGMKFEDGVNLFNKYMGNWGGTVTTYRFEAIKDGNVVGSIVKGPVFDIRLDTKVSHTVLLKEETYDVAEVHICARDQNGNTAHYFQEPLRLRASGSVSLIGPDVISLKGGMGGVYVRSKGTGDGSLLIESDRFGVQEIEFTVTKGRE